jgi:hypothetical protein
MVPARRSSISTPAQTTTKAAVRGQEMTMHAQQTDSHHPSMPVMIAILVAVVGQAAILLNDFGAGNGSRDGNPGMITAAAVSRAGATEIPSAPAIRRAAVVKNAT